jgi:hypothetical protein
MVLKNVLFISFIVLIFNCSEIYNKECSDLRIGTFEIYEKNKKIGFFYRKNDYQIEKYLNSDKYTIAKTNLKNCSFTLKSYEINEALDTITWSILYQKTKTPLALVCNECPRSS